MTRRYCNVCCRPEVSCICQFTVEVNNNVHVVVLQHTSEVKQSKGSVTLLSLSLNNCTCIVGEDFQANALFKDVLLKYQGKIALLYPSEQAELINDTLKSMHDIQCVIVLDGTWKKAYKMYQLNPLLHTLPHIKLPDEFESLYAIRKTTKKGGLSSLEACCHTLNVLDGQIDKYEPLLERFKAFNTYLSSFNKSR
ncbi:tRNA-uridine aminocarboxypropyltransferase [Thalassotalea fusca]